MTSVDCGGLGTTSSGAPEASGTSSSRTPAESGTSRRGPQTQNNVDLRSGEAELVEIFSFHALMVVKMSCQMIGMTQLASEWRLAIEGTFLQICLCIFADSSAAR